MKHEKKVKEFLIKHAEETEKLILREIVANGIVKEVNGKVTWSEKARVRLQERKDFIAFVHVKINKRINWLIEEDIREKKEQCVPNNREYSTLGWNDDRIDELKNLRDAIQ